MAGGQGTISTEKSMSHQKRGYTFQFLTLLTFTFLCTQGVQFHYLESWTRCLLANRKLLRECEGWRWAVYIYGTKFLPIKSKFHDVSSKNYLILYESVS